MKLDKFIGKGKCPKCEQGDVFSEKGNIFQLKSPKMIEKCSNCGYIFDRESGYFLGAFYVSYALTVFELLLIYFILQFLLTNVWIIISIMLLVLTLLSFFNFRVARLIWIQLFNK